MLVGDVRPAGVEALIANWRTTFHPNGAITAQIGGEAADGRLPAIVTRGRCKGPFERLEFDVPTARGRRCVRLSGRPRQRVGWRYR